MMKSELFSWPVTLVILAARVRIAGRSQPAADADDRRPHRLGPRALPRHAAPGGHLDLVDELRADVRPRSRHRLRALHRGSLSRRVLGLTSSPRSRPRASRWTPRARPCSSAGSRCSSPSRRSCSFRAPPSVWLSLGIMLSVIFILAATLTLLPAVLAQARAESRPPLAALGALGRAPLPAVRRLGRTALAPTARYGAPRWSSCSPSPPRSHSLKTAMPSIKVVPSGDRSRSATKQVQAAIGPGAPGALQLVVACSEARDARPHRPGTTPASPSSWGPSPPAAALALVRRSPVRTPPIPRSDRPSTACATSSPPGPLGGAAAAENHDLENLSPPRPRS